MNVCASGEWPSVDAMGTQWQEGSRRALMRGAPLFGKSSSGGLIRAVCCEISCDLDEYPKTLGLPHHRARHGCIACFASCDHLGDLDSPVRPRTHKWYQDLATTCMICTPISDADVPMLRTNLQARKKKGGLILKRKLDCMPELKRGDR
eukprot:7951465-Pyramimonas_sp.AAC.1